MPADPVCGMAVKQERPPATSQFEGALSYFCSTGCKVAFDHNPARYLLVGSGETAVPGATSSETTAPAKGDVLIRTVDLKKTYLRGRDRVHALQGMSLEMSQGELVVIMGPSGCGKSTLLHLLGGIDRPDSGQVLFDGQDLGQMSERELTGFRREKLGFIFQFYNLVPTLSAMENVELPLIALGFPRRGRRKMAEEVLGVMGLNDRLRHRPSELSGGEQQRVAIARAIVANPRLVLGDELTGDLDSKSTETVMDFLVRLNRDLGLTFVIVTHNPLVADRGTRVIYLLDGRIERQERR